MGGMSNQVCWRQRWQNASEKLLSDALQDCGCEVREIPSQEWNPANSTIGGVRDYKLSVIGSAGDLWSSILLHLNSLIGEDLAKRLSELQNEPVFLFTEFEQTVWGYSLFRNGTLVDRFWSDPEYLDEETNSSIGNADSVAATVGVESKFIAPYLRQLADDGEKAFLDDKFYLNDHWIRVDFMRRVGIEYPDIERSKKVLVVERGVTDKELL